MRWGGNCRAAISLARQWRDHGRQAEEGRLLAETYWKFTEGFATGDLVEARKLIAELGEV